MSKVIAMRAVKAEDHPDADALRVYEFEAPGDEHYVNVQVVANLENVYEVGDLVAVALEGSLLKDGTEIKPATLRGVPSHGMALGKVTKLDANPGDDLSSIYCQEGPRKPQMIKWPSIEHLHHVRKGVKAIFKSNEARPPVVKYKAKVKLDGTNGGVQVLNDGRVVAQSHSRLLIGVENYGFAAWVKENENYFRQIPSYVPTDTHVVVFGEWCGQGIQKRCSISQLDQKIFAVFALKFNYLYVFDPDDIRKCLPAHDQIYVIPWVKDFEVDLDYGALAEKLQEQADAVNKLVADVEQCDPWVKDQFGIEGLGEGVVMYPVNLEPHEAVDYMFKAKGEAHQVVRTKKSAQVTPEAAKGLKAFVELVVTPARLEQGVQEACDGEFVVQKIGPFLKWFAADVQKECQDEMKAAGLTWKSVGKAVSGAARDWYKAKAQEL